MTPSRTDIVVLVIFSAIAIAIAALVALRHFLGTDLVGWLPMPGKTVVGWVFFVLAALVCGWNFFLAFINPWLYKRAHGSLDGYASTSGLPIIGGLFVAVAAALLPESALLGAALLILFVGDGNGLPLALYAILRHGL